MERKTGGLGAGTGISAQAAGEGGFPGFVGSFSYSQRNLFGLNQKLSALVELGQVRALACSPWLVCVMFKSSLIVPSVSHVRACVVRQE